MAETSFRASGDDFASAACDEGLSGELGFVCAAPASEPLLPGVGPEARALSLLTHASWRALATNRRIFIKPC
jgi:hypothetical protein